MPISGSSPNKTFSRSDGTRVGSTVWVQSAAASRGIQATDQDYHDQDIATAINSCLFRDGGNAATGNLPMGGYKLTGLGSGSTSGDSVEYAQMNAAIAAANFPSGTKLVFPQPSAPTGWTKLTTADNAALRVVSGTTGGTYYSAGHAFSSATAGGAVDYHNITQAELPNVNFTVTDPGHSHTYTITTSGGPYAASGAGIVTASSSTGASVTGISVNSGGSGAGHTHTFTSSALNINYVDVIMASKN